MVRIQGFDRLSLLALAFEERGRGRLAADQQVIRAWVTEQLRDQHIAVSSESAG